MFGQNTHAKLRDINNQQMIGVATQNSQNSKNSN